MGRRVSGLMLSLIIVSMTLSGCISSKENSSNDNIDETPELILPLSKGCQRTTAPTAAIVNIANLGDLNKNAMAIKRINIVQIVVRLCANEY